MASCAGALLNATLALVDEQGIEGFTLRGMLLADAFCHAEPR
jgi:hypothetical protein